jgi:hypothetical protein
MLRAVLTANATSCLGFGAVFIYAPGDIAAFLGDVESWVILVLGLGLFVNGIHLAIVARRKAPKRLDVIYFSLGDAFWVLGTLFLIVFEIGVTSVAGILWALGIAVWVGLCGYFQWRWRPAT